MPVIIQNNPNGTIQTFSGLYALKRPWWLPTGIVSSNVIAAYQFKGAVDEANALLNVNNANVYPLSKVGTSTWNKNNGFTFAGGINGLTNSSLTTFNTVIVSYSNVETSESNAVTLISPKKLYTLYAKAGYDTGTKYYPKTIGASYGSNELKYSNITASNGIIAWTKSSDSDVGTLYYNGATIGSLTGPPAPGGAYNNSSYATIGSSITNSSLAYSGSTIQAVAFYNTLLTAAQIVELTASMQNL